MPEDMPNDDQRCKGEDMAPTGTDDDRCPVCGNRVTVQLVLGTDQRVVTMHDERDGLPL